MVLANIIPTLLSQTISHFIAHSYYFVRSTNATAIHLNYFTTFTHVGTSISLRAANFLFLILATQGSETFTQLERAKFEITQCLVLALSDLH